MSLNITLLEGIWVFRLPSYIGDRLVVKSLQQNVKIGTIGLEAHLDPLLCKRLLIKNREQLVAHRGVTTPFL